jgi:hypothetical protein
VEENRAQELLDNQPWSQKQLGEYNRVRSRRDDFRTAAISVAGAGGGLLLVGAALWAFDDADDSFVSKEAAPSGEPDSKGELVALPLLSPEIAGVGLSGTFF